MSFYTPADNGTRFRVWLVFLIGAALLLLLSPTVLGQQAAPFDTQHAKDVFKDVQDEFLALNKRTPDSPNPARALKHFQNEAFHEYVMTWKETGGRRVIVKVEAFINEAMAKDYLLDRKGSLSRRRFAPNPVASKPAYVIYTSKKIMFNEAQAGRFVASVTVVDTTAKANLLAEKPEEAALDLLVSRLGGTQTQAMTPHKLIVESPLKGYKDFDGTFQLPADDALTLNLKVLVTAGGSKVTGAKVDLESNVFKPSAAGEYVLRLVGTGKKEQSLTKTVELTPEEQHYRLVFSKDGYRPQFDSVQVDPEIETVTLPGRVIDARYKERKRQTVGVEGVTVLLKGAGVEQEEKTGPDGSFSFTFKQTLAPTAGTSDTLDTYFVKMVAEAKFDLTLNGQKLGTFENGKWEAEKTKPAIRIPSETKLGFELTYLDEQGQTQPLGTASVDIDRVDNKFMLGTREIPASPAQPTFAKLGKSPSEHRATFNCDAEGVGTLNISVGKPSGSAASGDLFGDADYLADRMKKVATKLTLKIAISDPISGQKPFQPFIVEVPFDVLIVHGRVELTSAAYLDGPPVGPDRYHLASSRQRLAEKLNPQTGRVMVEELDRFWLLLSRPENNATAFLETFHVKWDLDTGKTDQVVRTEWKHKGLKGRPMINLDTGTQGLVGNSIPEPRTVIYLGTARFSPDGGLRFTGPERPEK